MTYNYSSYVHYSADRTHIYATAVVDGSATCNNTHIQSLNCSAIYHQGKVNLTIGNTGGWVYGGQVNPNSYISVTNSQTLANPAFNTDYTLNSAEEVFCSGAVALVFLQGGPTVFRIATTYFGPPVVETGDKCYWGSLACSAGTQPTCKAGSGYTFAPACPQYVRTDYLVVNNGITAPVCISIGDIFAATGPGPCN